MKNVKQYFSFLNKRNFTNLEKLMINWFGKLPKLSNSVIDFITSFGPYLVLIGGILSVLSIFSFFSLTNIIFYTYSPFINPLSRFIYLSVIGTVLSGILLIMAYDDLKNLKIFGWRLVFWATNLNIITAFFSLNILGSIIGALVSWYLLSQIYTKYQQ